MGLWLFRLVFFRAVVVGAYRRTVIPVFFRVVVAGACGRARYSFLGRWEAESAHKRWSL